MRNPEGSNIDWIDLASGTFAANIPTGVLVRYGSDAICFVPGLMVTEPEKRNESAFGSLEPANFGKLVPIPQDYQDA